MFFPPGATAFIGTEPFPLASHVLNKGHATLTAMIRIMGLPSSVCRLNPHSLAYRFHCVARDIQRFADLRVALPRFPALLDCSSIFFRNILLLKICDENRKQSAAYTDDAILPLELLLKGRSVSPCYHPFPGIRKEARVSLRVRFGLVFGRSWDQSPHLRYEPLSRGDVAPRCAWCGMQSIGLRMSRFL